jgi:hypothetical protein
MSVPHITQLQSDEVRAEAFRRLLEAEPMPVEDWPIMKRQMIEDMNAGGMSILDTYD